MRFEVRMPDKYRISRKKGHVFFRQGSWQVFAYVRNHPLYHKATISREKRCVLRMCLREQYAAGTSSTPLSGSWYQKAHSNDMSAIPGGDRFQKRRAKKQGPYHMCAQVVKLLSALYNL